MDLLSKHLDGYTIASMVIFRTVWSRIAFSLYLSLSGLLALLSMDATTMPLPRFLTPLGLGISLTCLHFTAYLMMLSA